MADYISKFPAHQIDALLEQGVPIYDDVSKLPQDATVGSVAVVAVPGTSKESSFRDLYQPDASILDMSTGTITNPNILSSVSSIKVTAPEGNIEGVNISILIVPRDFSSSNSKMIGIDVATSDNIVTKVDITMMVDNFIQSSLITYNDGVPTVDNSIIETINNYLASGDWCYLGYPMGGTGITGEQFATLDKFIHPVTDAPSTAEIYIKRDNWENYLLNVNDKIDNIIINKNDKLVIKNYESGNYVDIIIHSNIYYRIPKINSFDLFLRLTPSESNEVINEYMIELICQADINDVLFKNDKGESINIKWANNVPPTFSNGTTVIMSIIGEYGVYATFSNS